MGDPSGWTHEHKCTNFREPCKPSPMKDSLLGYLPTQTVLARPGVHSSVVCLSCQCFTRFSAWIARAAVFCCLWKRFVMHEAGAVCGDGSQAWERAAGNRCSVRSENPQGTCTSRVSQRNACCSCPNAERKCKRVGASTGFDTLRTPSDEQGSVCKKQRRGRYVIREETVGDSHFYFTFLGFKTQATWLRIDKVTPLERSLTMSCDASVHSCFRVIIVCITLHVFGCSAPLFAVSMLVASTWFFPVISRPLAVCSRPQPSRAMA